LFSDTVGDVIQYEAVSGATSKPKIKTEWYNDSTNTYVDFEDIEGRTIELSNENKRYQVYSFMPPSKSIRFTLNNFDQVYSTGSGDAKASILKKNLLVRAWTGYELTLAEGQASQSDDFSSTNKLVHTQLSSGKIIYDSSSYAGTVDSGLVDNLYGTTTYGDTTYEYSGYYQKTFTISNDERQFKQASVTVNSANFDFTYRVSPNADFSGAGWSIPQSLSSGANTINFVADLNDDYLQVAILWKNENFGTSDELSALSILKEDNLFLFPQGVFVLDQPDFQDTKVSCRGRDYLKKALETEINMPDMTSSVNIGTAVSYVLDRCSIPYDRSEWDSTSTAVSVSGTLSEQFNNISGWKTLDLLMDALNAGNDNWRLKTEDNGNLSLKILETDNEVDYSIHYKFNIESIDKDLDSDKQLQRVTCLNKDIIVNQESLIKSYTGTATSLHLTYGGSYLYVRYTDDNSVITSEDDRTNTAIDFTLSGSTADIDIYGCTPKNAITDEVWAERGNSNNIVKNDGSTYKRVNPFMDATQCKAFVDYLLPLYDDPAKKVNLTMVPNPYLELNDNCLVFDLYTYTDDVYGITSITETFRDPGLKVSMRLQDRGFDLGQFIYDRNGRYEGINDLLWDSNLVFDQDLAINATVDSTDYAFQKQIPFS
jgi:hypothetical protein